MKKAKILIVEDEIISAAALRSDLKGMGYDVCALASTGWKAIEIAENEHPDVVLMDVRLRGDMDGIEASKEILSRVGVPSIFMSGYSIEAVKKRMGSAESFRLISKPVEAEDVKEAIDSVLRERKV